MQWFRRLRSRVYVVQLFALLVMFPIGFGLVSVPHRGGGQYLYALSPVLPVALGGVMMACAMFLFLTAPTLPDFAQVLFMTPYLIWAYQSVPLALDLSIPPFLIAVRLYLYLVTILAIIRRTDHDT